MFYISYSFVILIVSIMIFFFCNFSKNLLIFFNFLTCCFFSYSSFSFSNPFSFSYNSFLISFIPDFENLFLNSLKILHYLICFCKFQQGFDLILKEQLIILPLTCFCSFECVSFLRFFLAHFAANSSFL